MKYAQGWKLCQVLKAQSLLNSWKRFFEVYGK